MSDPKSVKRLLEAADRDIETLKLLFAESPEESFGFHESFSDVGSRFEDFDRQ